MTTINTQSFTEMAAYYLGLVERHGIDFAINQLWWAYSEFMNWYDQGLGSHRTKLIFSSIVDSLYAMQREQQLIALALEDMLGADEEPWISDPNGNYEG